MPSNWLIPISNSEKIWKADQEEMKRQLQPQQEKEKENEITIITDTIGDQSLQPSEDSFISFSIDSNVDMNASDSDDSGLWNLNKNYSWYERYCK